MFVYVMEQNGSPTVFQGMTIETIVAMYAQRGETVTQIDKAAFDAFCAAHQ